MAEKSRLKSGNYRIQFRISRKTHSRTFKSELEADAYAARIDHERELIRNAESSKLPVDMAALYQSLHTDLQKAVQLLPSFAKVLGAVAAKEVTLARLVDEFAHQYDKKDPNLVNRLKWWVRHYGQLTIDEFTEDHVRHAVNKLMNEGTTGKSGLQPQSTNRFKANLSSVFEFGRERYHIKVNPCRQVRSRPEGKGRKRYLSIDEQKRFLEAARQAPWDKFYLLSLIAITTGARRGELEKLRWKDIDWDKCQAHCGDTKNGSDKILHLTDAVMVELKRFREIGNGLIFANPLKPTSVYDFRYDWKKVLEIAEIPLVDEKGEKLVFHSLRHTFCSTLANTGAELHEIANLAGHKSLQTTMRYTHCEKRRLAERVNGTFEHLSSKMS